MNTRQQMYSQQILCVDCSAVSARRSCSVSLFSRSDMAFDISPLEDPAFPDFNGRVLESGDVIDRPVSTAEPCDALNPTPDESAARLRPSLRL